MAPTRGNPAATRTAIVIIVILINLIHLISASLQTHPRATSNLTTIPHNSSAQSATSAPQHNNGCQSGLLTFELATGFIYKPSSEETLAMMPSTLQLTDCLDYCLHNTSCLAINFEMGLCVLLSSSAKQNPNNLYSSQFPVFTIYAEKKCLLAGDPQATRQRRKCQRAWTFERVAGYEMKTKARRRLKLATKELCMEFCLLEREFECRSANWYRQTNECTLSDQDRHSVSQSEAGDQQIKASALHNLYGPGNVTHNGNININQNLANSNKVTPISSSSLYENYYANLAALNERIKGGAMDPQVAASASAAGEDKIRRRLLSRRSVPIAARPPNEDNARVYLAGSSSNNSNQKYRKVRQLYDELSQHHRLASYLFKRQQNLDSPLEHANDNYANNIDDWHHQQPQSAAPNQYIDITGGTQQYQPIVSDSPVDYLENNCIFEPNKLCEFRKIQNRILKTVDSIYQDVASVDECKQKCLNAPYRCYSFDYGDTSERVCRTSHLDQASLLAVKEPYLDVVGAITYELASCFNVTIQCRAKEMVASVSSSKMFKGKIYAKTRPSSCVNDVGESLKFELSMKYHDEGCNVRASSNSQQGVFSNDIVIQNHDRIVTTQDVGLSVYCQYDLGNRSITNNVDLAIEKLEAPTEGKHQPMAPIMANSTTMTTSGRHPIGQQQQLSQSASSQSPLMITGLATTVVRSPNVTMRITNMNGQPVASATVGDRLALLFEVKEKTSPFGIFVREIVAMDGRQVMQNLQAAVAGNKQGVYHYASTGGGAGDGLSNNATQQPLQLNEHSLDYMIQTNSMANSVQFIDSDGCPTDANIMGPLIKMDPNGHRILAPFDAFKFPTSDMVFFRAVVTSCLAECAPVVCSPGGPSPVFGSLPTVDNHLDLAASPRPPAAPATVKPPTYHQNSYMDLVSRTTLNSPPKLGNSQAGGLQMSTTTLPTSARYQPLMSTTSPMSSSSSSMPPASNYEQFERMASSPMVSSVTPSSQLMYTTSGGLATAQTKPTQASITTTPLPMTTAAAAAAPGSTNRLDFERRTTTQLPSEGQTDALTTIPGFGASSESNVASQWQSQNVTNNHNGRAPAKLSSTTLAPSKFSSLNSMSDQQKLQIVQLFEAKLKQQLPDAIDAGSSNASSISDLADLYTGFLATLVLKNSLANGNGNKTTSGNLMMAPDIESAVNNYKRNNENSNGAHLSEDQFQMANSNELPDPAQASQSSAGSDFDRLLSHLTNEITNANDNGSGANNASQISGLSEFVNLLSLVSSTTTTTTTTAANSQQADGDFATEMNINRLGDEVTLAADSGQQAASQQQPPPMDLMASDNNLDANSRFWLDRQQQQHQHKLSHWSTTTSTATPPTNSRQIGSQLGDNNGHLAAAAAAATSGKDKAQPLTSQQKRRMSHQQALANEYLGPYQSMGKRRRRRDTGGDEFPSAAGYVYMEQPLGADAGTETEVGNTEQLRFTRAIVELYHTQPMDVATEHDERRQKRSAPPSNPTYDMEELVVQSIKIVDRMHFEDEQQQAAEGNRKSKRNLLRSAKSGENMPLTSGFRLANWSSAGVLSVLIMAMSFIFVQVFLVAIYLIDWSRRRRRASQSRGGTIKSQSQPNGSQLSALTNSDSTALYSTWTPSTLRASTGDLSDYYAPIQSIRFEDLATYGKHSQYYINANEQQVDSNDNLDDYYYALSDPNFIRFSSQRDERG